MKDRIIRDVCTSCPSIGPRYLIPSFSKILEGAINSLVSRFALERNFISEGPPGTWVRKLSASLCKRVYAGLVINSLKYLERAPTFLAIDHSLSFNTRMNLLVELAMLFRASKVIPQVNAASPATAIT